MAVKIHALCLALIAASLGRAAHAETALLWRLAPGQRLELHVEQKSTSTTLVEDRELPARSTASIHLRWQVADVSAQGEASIEQTITGLTLSIQVPGEAPFDFDSRQEAPAGRHVEFQRAFAALASDKAILRLSPRGEIVSVQTSPAVEQALRRLPRRIQVGELLTREGLQKLLGQALPHLPEHEVKAGDAWQGQVEAATAIGRFRLNNTYVYQGLGGEDEAIHRVRVSSQAALVEESIPPGVELRIVEQEGAGEFAFHLEAGHPTESRLSRKMTLEVAVGEAKVRQAVSLESKLAIQPAAE